MSQLIFSESIMNKFCKLIFRLIGLVFLLAATVTQAQEDILIERLQKGGLNIFFRHAITPGKDP